MKFLVLYATVEGQTQKIAESIAAQLENLGGEVFLTNVIDPGYCDPGMVDAAILCAPIHIGNYPSAFVQYIQNWKSALLDIPTALVTVSLAIASEDPVEQEEARKFPENLSRQTGWNTDYHHNAAGALKYLEYDFFKKWMMRRIVSAEGGPVDTSRDHELTDWDALTEFIANFAGDCTPAK